MVYSFISSEEPGLFKWGKQAMSQQPKTETDRLANVIQVLQLGQKTGSLVVERNDGPHSEQGVITLVNGQIIQASVGQWQGQDALVWLSNWGHCRFSFSAEQKPMNSGNTGHMPAMSPLRESAYGQSFSSPLPTTKPGPMYRQQNPFTGARGNSPGSGSGPLSSMAWNATPLRIRQIEEGMHLIEQMGLSRAHRRLFLLIDGRRTFQELARLMSHEPAEVYRLLKELERAGVVQA